MNIPAFINQNFNKTDLGLLLLRVVFGLLILNAGVIKLLGGSEMLTGVGSALAKFGITFAPLFWGLMAALAETLGGICVVLGVFFRPANFFLVFTMIVAVAVTWGDGPGGDLQKFLSPEGILVPGTFCVVFLALLLSGPGRYAINLGGGGRSGGSKSSAKE